MNAVDECRCAIESVEIHRRLDWLSWWGFIEFWMWFPFCNSTTPGKPRFVSQLAWKLRWTWNWMETVSDMKTRDKIPFRKISLFRERGELWTWHHMKKANRHRCRSWVSCCSLEVVDKGFTCGKTLSCPDRLQLSQVVSSCSREKGQLIDPVC